MSAATKWEAISGKYISIWDGEIPQVFRAASEADMALMRAAPDLLAVVHDLSAFVAVMIGRGPDAIIPETQTTPLGVPVKIGEIMRDARAAITKATGEAR